MIYVCAYGLSAIIGFTLGYFLGIPGILISIPIGFAIGMAAAALDINY